MATNQSSYIAEYRKRKYAERKIKITNLLGGSCNKCRSKENLEIDHIDQKEKSFEVMRNCWWMSWSRLLVEVKKCQLLCEKCHNDKTSVAKDTHGTLSSYRWCKCKECRAAKSKYDKEWKLNDKPVKYRRPKTGLVHGTSNAYAYYKCRCDICKEGHRIRLKKYRETT